jgi:hypothetical protein
VARPTSGHFFLGMLKPILKLLPIWISSLVAQARFQQLIFYSLPDRVLISPFSFSAPGYSVKGSINSTR